jgi:hypothetical protein
MVPIGRFATAEDLAAGVASLGSSDAAYAVMVVLAGGGLGPMAGDNHHFSRYAPEKISYAIERYVKETNRLYGVLDRRLTAQPYLAGCGRSGLGEFDGGCLGSPMRRS